jgi:hypothetical protein
VQQAHRRPAKRRGKPAGAPHHGHRLTGHGPGGDGPGGHLGEVHQGGGAGGECGGEGGEGQGDHQEAAGTRQDGGGANFYIFYLFANFVFFTVSYDTMSLLEDTSMLKGALDMFCIGLM